MATMDTHQLATALIAAVLAFKHKWDADKEAESLDRATMSPEQQAATVADIQPEELDEQDWWQHFTEFVEHNGVGKFLDVRHNPDIACFAALKKGEPSFTLRGQDIFASILTRHWCVLAESLSEDLAVRKLNAAERIAEAMEDYHPQKMPD
jgi:hypothetical protein